jgi:hypothetical protein
MVVSWRDFLKESPPFSIALDGYVAAPTKRDLKGPRANYDHHKGVDRISTRSTSDQVAMEINLGLFDAFIKDGQPFANIFVNDCDEDTCLAVWLLKHHERVLAHGEPMINRLIFCEDRLDCTAGTYPFRESETLRKIAWVFEPYNAARRSGRLSKISGDEIVFIIESVGQRITEYSLGGGGSQELNDDYKPIGGGPSWTFITEAGPQARMKMSQGGIKAYVNLISPGRYSLGRVSEWVQFPLEEIFPALNDAENLKHIANWTATGNAGLPPPFITAANRWDGSNTVGGSPRNPPGSLLSPQEVEAVLNQVLEKHSGLVVR